MLAATSMQVNDAAYRNDLAAIQSSSDQFADLEACGFVRLPCQDRAGRPVVMVVPQQLPAQAEAIEAERLYRFVIQKLDSIANAPFSVVYVHSGADEWKVRPTTFALRTLYERYAPLHALSVHLDRHWLSFCSACSKQRWISSMTQRTQLCTCIQRVTADCALQAGSEVQAAPAPVLCAAHRHGPLGRHELRRAFPLPWILGQNSVHSSDRVPLGAYQAGAGAATLCKLHLSNDVSTFRIERLRMGPALLRCQRALDCRTHCCALCAAVSVGLPSSSSTMGLAAWPVLCHTGGQVQGSLEGKLPRFVCEHDGILEKQPLHDFGYVKPDAMPLPEETTL